nr:EAL domain-containing protein [Natronocella acetinitrilica]
MLDSKPEEAYERYTRFAATLFDTPMALVTLLDERRQWFKSCLGVDLRETDRQIAFCDAAIRSQDALVVTDALEDPRFATNPLVTGAPHIRFYAGVPLVSRDGYALGTLCVLDTRPRHDIGEQQIQQLRELANAVLSQMELRRAVLELERAGAALRDRETLLARIYDSVETGIAIADGEGFIVEANAYLWRLLEWPRSAFIGQSVGQIFTAGVDAVVGSDGEAEWECRIRNGRGSLIDVAVAMRTLRLSSGEQTQVIAVSDLHRQKAEERLVRMRADILQRIIAQDPLPEVLSDLCKMLEGQVAQARALVTRQEDGGLVGVAGPSLAGEGGDESLIGVLLRGGVSLSADAAARGEILICEDLEIEHRWPQSRQLLLARGIRSALVVPVPLADGSIAGTLGLFWTEPGLPAPRTRLIAEEYARLVGVALAHGKTVASLQFRAYHDSLTGLANRELFADRVKGAIARAHRSGGVVGVLMLDLDDFKLINDSLGHAMGDLLLLEVGQRLRDCVRESDTVARLGGDEFALVIETGSAPEVALVAGKILRKMAGPADLDGHRLHISPSIGVAVHPDDGADPAQLLQAADTAMYEVKRSGKRGLRVYDVTLAETATRNFTLMQELAEAVQQGRIVAHVQPRVDLESGTVPAMEAYARWSHPRLGEQEADFFLPMAEQAGLTRQIDRIVLEQTLPLLAAARRLRPDFRLCWNVSIATLYEQEFVEKLRARLDAYGLPTDCLQLDLVEAQLLRSLERSVARLNEIREQLPGLRVGLDDFGITHGAITTLPALPLDSLTVDRSFTARLLAPDARTRTVARTLVSALVNLSRDLEMDLVVEGVETEQQLRELRELGCRVMQGRFFLAPAATLPEGWQELGAGYQAKRL